MSGSKSSRPDSQVRASRRKLRRALLPRKTRADSPLEKLSLVAREALDQLLFREGLGYRAVAARLMDAFGIRTSKSALARYFARETNRRELKSPEPISPDDLAQAILLISEMPLENVAPILRNRPGLARSLLRLLEAKNARHDSPLDRLPDAQRARLNHWLFVANLSHQETAARLLSEFGVRASRSALSSYYTRQTILSQAGELPPINEPLYRALLAARLRYL
jgi:hypothetical protein